MTEHRNFLLNRLRKACPECDAEVTIWKRVCFGPDAHNEYACFACGWRGRKPVAMLVKVHDEASATGGPTDV